MRAFLAVLVLAGMTLTTAKAELIGSVQAEIRLADGTVFTKAKILDCSPEHATATIGDAKQIRTVPLKDLPAPLREQLLRETEKTPPRRRIYRAAESRPPAPPDKVIVAAPTTATGVPATSVDELIQQATAAAPDELKFYLTKTYDRLASLTTKVRTAEQVPGWQKVRVSGDASFSEWDQSQHDYVWRTEKFEVTFDIVDAKALKIAAISFGGVSRIVD